MSRAGLQPGDPLADVIDQDLRPRPRQRSHAGRDQPRQAFLDGEVRHLADVQDFVGGKGVQIDRWIFLLQPAEEIFVILDPALRIETALQQDLDAAGRHGLVDLGGQFLFAQRIASRPTGGPIKGAESAVDVADVRVVDVPFDDVRYPPARMQLVTTHVGRQPEIGQ